MPSFQGMNGALEYPDAEPRESHAYRGSQLPTAEAAGAQSALEPASGRPGTRLQPRKGQLLPEKPGRQGLDQGRELQEQQEQDCLHVSPDSARNRGEDSNHGAIPAKQDAGI